MPGVNKVILLGHLGADPELRFTGSGQPVAEMRMATSEQWKDKDGNRQERTEWHRLVVWGKLAEVCAKYLAKGRQVYVEGRIQTRTWDDKDGIKRYTTEIVVAEVQFLGGGKGEGGDRRESDAAPEPDFERGSRQSFGGGSAPDDGIPFASCDATAEPSAIAPVLRAKF